MAIIKFIIFFATKEDEQDNSEMVPELFSETTNEKPSETKADEPSSIIASNDNEIIEVKIQNKEDQETKSSIFSSQSTSTSGNEHKMQISCGNINIYLILRKTKQKTTYR